MTGGLGELDLHLAGEGRHERLYERLGAHVVDGGVRFAVWAPNARSVSVVGDWNAWSEDADPLGPVHSSGIWEGVVADAAEGAVQAAIVRRRRGHAAQGRPVRVLRGGAAGERIGRLTLALPRGPTALARAAASTDPLSRPMSIYEVHPGSWRQGLSWSQLAARARPVRDRARVHACRADARDAASIRAVLGLPGQRLLRAAVHVRVARRLPVPRRRAPSSRHRRDSRLGPAHFPRDDWALARFDGTALYEHEDARRGSHPDWGTLIFNLSRHEVRNFLLANALYWVTEFHADGLRVDAVASMLYLDYSREAGGVAPERARGSREPRGGRVPARAERGSACPRAGCLGHGRGVDRLAGRLAADLDGRARVHLQVEHGLDARHALLRSSTSRSIAGSTTTSSRSRSCMRGTRTSCCRSPTTRSCTARARCSPSSRATAGRSSRRSARCSASMWAHPGKQLLFMGGELAQWDEWSEARRSTGRCSTIRTMPACRRCVRDLNAAYLAEPALWEVDFRPDGFAWLVGDARDENVIAFARFSPAAAVARLRRRTSRPSCGRAGGCRCRPGARGARCSIPIRGSMPGSDVGNGAGIEADQAPLNGQPFSAFVTLPPLATLWLVPEPA